MVALFMGASSADAHVVSEGGARPRPRPPGHGLRVQTGILASPSLAPVGAPPPAGVGGGLYYLTASQVAYYAAHAGFPASVVPTMVAIAARESGFNAHAVNLSSGACGLWQLYPCPGLQALDPATNAALAYAKYEASGLGPWGYG